MAENYFKKFPLVNYNNIAAVNLSERSVVTETAFRNPYVYYPYDLSENERPDILADRYYNDQYMDWILYLGNKVTDPYYGWYLSTDDFHACLKKKYNKDIYTLQNTIKFYRNNWYENDSVISVPAYLSMANTLHKFWEPVYYGSNVPGAYKRVEKDWIINTNAVRRYEADGSNFIKDEVVTINFDEDNVGKGQVLAANSSTVTLQHISGVSLPDTEILITESSYLFGRESNANSMFTSATNIADNIDLEEVVYWSPVSIYDYEYELNDQKKTINVLNNNYSMKISKQLTNLMK